MELTISNAPHWLNHSYVRLKGLYLAEDEAAIQNGITSVEMVNGTPTVSARGGDVTMLKLRRMVIEGKVAVMLRGGHKYEVSLPGEVGQLLPADITYISAQIDALSQPMSAEEQASFLASQNGHVEASLELVK